MIAGRAADGEMVCGPGPAMLKEIVSKAADAFESSTACSNEPGPDALVFVTENVAASTVDAENTNTSMSFCSLERPPPRCFVPPALTTEELLDDVFTPIARDGAGLVEVQVRLQKAFGALARQEGGRCRRGALVHSRAALQRAEQGLTFDPNRERVRKAASEVTG